MSISSELYSQNSGRSRVLVLIIKNVKIYIVEFKGPLLVQRSKLTLGLRGAIPLGSTLKILSSGGFLVFTKNEGALDFSFAPFLDVAPVPEE